MIDFNKIQKIYISGIGGIGVSAIARLFLEKGFTVLGSDLDKNEITELLEQKGCKISYKQVADNITEDIDLHIYSTAVPEDNPERKKIKELKIPSFSYPEILGELSKNKHTVAISGTNGKTTTTAMIGHILKLSKKDPTVIVGSLVPLWKSNFILGKSDYFVVEACEYQAHMLNLHTTDIIVTNIEEEHLDFYKDIQDIKEHFLKFVQNNNKNGFLILNADDKHSQILIDFARKNKRKLLTYGIKNKSDVQAYNIEIREGKQIFSVKYGKALRFHNFEISLPGIFNVYNALASIAFCVSQKIKFSKIRDALKSFQSTWRRFQYIGKYKGADIILDYAHHPTAISWTIQAAREFYPNKRIITVFQPHQYDRTLKLFKDFVRALKDSDIIILPEIFEVKGRENESLQQISSVDLATELQRLDKEAFYTADFIATKNILDQYVSRNDVILIMGAGDIYKIINNLK